MTGETPKFKLSKGSPDHNYVSIDSAPLGLSIHVDLWRAPGLLITFIVISSALLWVVEKSLLTPFLQGGDLVFAPIQGEHGMPLRVFFLSFLASFGLFSHGRLSWRIGFVADMALTYMLMCAFIDVAALTYDVALGFSMTLNVIEIMSGLIGYAIFSFKLLERGNMPSRIKVHVDQTQNTKTILRLIFVVLLAATFAISVTEGTPKLIDFLRSYALLGGIGPGVILFLPATFLFLYLLGRVDMITQDTADFSPPLTIIIPAHNEEHIIARTIQSIDIAAGKYEGSLTILVMDNNSTDSTSIVANSALADCVTATGRVIAEPRPGKSHALNAALDAAETEYVIRIDADTQVGPDSIRFAMRRMKDPKVGVVGGLPIPPGGGIFDHARLLELVVKHGFYSVGLSAINAVVGVPGMFAAYRLKLPRSLGGFVQGMNGEDTDMSLRIGELGYRLIIDPRIRFVSEVPGTFKHMREQRLRWFRSVFHVSARCRDLIYSRKVTIRGKLLLPFMLLNSAMRAMLVPLVLFGTLLLVPMGFEPRSIPWRAIVAVTIGAPALMSIIALLLNRQFRGILYLPEYLIFRVMRAYFTLESTLSITVRDHGAHLYSAEERLRPAEKERRDA